MRISNSFSEGEIQVMEFILQSLLRGSVPSTATRNKDFASLYRKVMTMKSRLGDQKAARAAKGAPTESSVGTVDAPTDAELDERKAS